MRNVAVGAGVHEHLAARVPLGVEEEPPLGRPAGEVGADVADEEAVVEGEPVERDARACAAAPPPRPVQSTVNGAECAARSVTSLAPAQVDQRLRGDALVEDLLGARLREVHERRERRAARRRRRCGRTARRSRWNVRAVVQVTPSAAIRSPAPTEAQMSSTSRCWQIALRADEVPGGSLVEHDRRHAPAGEQQRRRLPDRPGSDDEHGLVRPARHVLELRPRPPGPARPSRSPAARHRTARPTAATRRTAGSARRSASARTARAGRRGRRRTRP